MTNISKILIVVFLMIGLIGCNSAKKQDLSNWRQNLEEAIPYKIESSGAVVIQSVGQRHVIKAKDGFKLVLLPPEGPVWNMEWVSVLGLMLKNTGDTELVMDMMLCNKGATGWSNSSLGRTIVEAGEEMPLAVALTRRQKNWHNPDSGYLEMSGLPSGHFSHWHTLDPNNVINLTINCHQKGEHSFELAQMFPLQKMDKTYMNVFPFIDKYGQYIHREWPDKVRRDSDLCRSIAFEKRLEKELLDLNDFSQYGGWKAGPKFEAKGFFYTKKYKDKWWFVDPQGYLFWSYGVDCAGIQWAGQTLFNRDPNVFEGLPGKDDKKFGQFYTPRDIEYKYVLMEDVLHYDFTRANLYRKYGKDWDKKYLDHEIRRLKYCRLNTIGAWSDDELAAQKKVPYTVMLHYEYPRAALKLPDPFDSETRMGLRKAIHEYPVDFKNDPWCIGAFVNNELHWMNNTKDMISVILSYKVEGTAVKKTFRDWLKKKYVTIAKFNEGWKTQFVAWDDLLKVNERDMFKDANSDDCAALAKLFANAFFGMVKEELTSYSPNILYLGCRFHVGPVEVIKVAGKYVDVVSTNLYAYSPNVGRYSGAGKPILITEFHYANTAGNNLGGGLRAAQNAQQQGRLLRAYIADAVEHPQIIGAHWFQWRDQNVGGRFDGENYDVGFFDVADMPNVDLIRASEEVGRSLYNCVK